MRGGEAGASAGRVAMTIPGWPSAVGAPAGRGPRARGAAGDGGSRRGGMNPARRTAAPGRQAGWARPLVNRRGAYIVST